MFNVTINPDGAEPYDVTIGTRDVVKWERGDKSRNITKAQEAGLRLSDLYELSYYAAVRTGNFKGTQEKFESQNDLDFEVDEDPNTSGQAA